MTTFEMIKKFTDKVNKEGNVTIKIYDCTDKNRVKILARAIVVTDLLIVWNYVLFSDGTYTFYLMDRPTEKDDNYYNL